MPEINRSSFGKFPRFDGKNGHIEIIPTTMPYVEADGTDVRVRRVRVFGPDGKQERHYLMDEMGVPFKDLTDVADDPDYLDSLK